jgi:hypothetical protein
MTDKISDRLSAPARLRGAWLSAASCLMMCAALSACAIHWPWKHKPKPAPQPVHYVTLAPDAAPISEYWDRNALQFDLTALSGEGSATLSQIASVGWPVRLEFLVRPGSFGQLEVVGAQRVVYLVPTQGSANLVFKLASGVYPADTRSITLRWRAADDSQH